MSNFLNRLKRVLITVGTTEFEELIEELNEKSESFVRCLKALGCECLVVQIGRGILFPAKIKSECDSKGIICEIFRYKPSITEDMTTADLIVSHCGAGSIIEALSMQKLLIVVVNTSLQGNHQTELADALSKDGYCVSTEPKNVINCLLDIELTLQSSNLVVKTFPKVDHSIFPKIVDSMFE